MNINELEFKKFPGGELHLTKSWLSVNNNKKVVCRIKNSDDLMKLCLFTDAYKHVYNCLPEELILPYIPYARQDRYAQFGEALSIRVFANILNTLNYSKVTVLDPHSDVCTALINNINIMPQWDIWSKILLQEFSKALPFDLISPDVGALKKIYNLQSSIGTKSCNNIRVGTKHRDLETGAITKTTVDGEAINPVGIIVDDICDGGRTFIELAKILRNQYQGLYLCVTHGIFSNGLDVLSDFDNVYCIDSFDNIQSKDKLKVINLVDRLEEE